MRCATLVKSPPCVPPKRCASWHCGFDAPVYDLCSCRSLPHTATWHDWKSWQAHGHIMTSAPSQDDGKKGEPSDTERLEWRDQWTEMNRMNRNEHKIWMTEWFQMSLFGRDLGDFVLSRGKTEVFGSELRWLGHPWEQSLSQRGPNAKSLQRLGRLGRLCSCTSLEKTTSHIQKTFTHTRSYSLFGRFAEV